MKEEEQIKRRLVEIEHEMLRCNDLPKIWKLKKEHTELTRLLRRILRERNK